MPILEMFLMVLGLVLFFLAMLGVPSPPGFNLMAGGLFCWLLSILIARVPLR
jgi:hypothetical protein